MPVSESLLEQIRTENLNVYRASSQRLREDVGQESQIAQDYRGRLVYELLQNADDAMSGETTSACVRFVLTDSDLWVANSGRALTSADIRGLCGISASSKSLPKDQKRRASIGHKGMGFKSALEITEAPAVFSTSMSFQFSPREAMLAVQPLLTEGKLEGISRAPTTRFPFALEQEEEQWADLRETGMNTAFRFPLRPKLKGKQSDNLASVLKALPVTSLVFLKHIKRVEVEIRQTSDTDSFCWSVSRENETENGWNEVSSFSESGNYRVTLSEDNGPNEVFFLAYDTDIAISDHRGGLDEFSWEGVEYTEISIAARMMGNEPIAINDSWKLIHVFLPTGEPCPYNLLVSGAFGSNLSRQEIRVEHTAENYNSFLFRQAARVFCDKLLPKLISNGATALSCIKLLDRKVEPLSRCNTAAAQVFYEAVREALGKMPVLPAPDGRLLKISECAVPPIVPDEDVGREFRELFPSDKIWKEKHLAPEAFCGANLAGILVDHGAHPVGPEDSAALLASADPERSKLKEHPTGKIQIDPVLSVLEKLWMGLGPNERSDLAAASRRYELFPVANVDNTVHRVRTENLTCFYPPRKLHGSVPLTGLSFLLQDICWGTFTNNKERNNALLKQMEAWKTLFDIREFRFPEVMRASVLPALELEQSNNQDSERPKLHQLSTLAAICQLAGRTPNENAPLPYERLGPNRALFNLSRLDVPCRGTSDGDIKWVPAYKAYFGTDWFNTESVEVVLKTAQISSFSNLPDINFVVGPERFAGLLTEYRGLEIEEDSDHQNRDVGEDEISVDEDEDSTLETEEQKQWKHFLQWLGVNKFLRPVHFHDVEDRASGWLKTVGLRKPDGWAFQNIPDNLWEPFVQNIQQRLVQNNVEQNQNSIPYFYNLHDLEYLVAFTNIASSQVSADVAKSLYEHLARNWIALEKFSQVRIAQVPMGNEPARRTKPPRANEDELVDGGVNLWLFRLMQNVAFCPTHHGPRTAAQTWLPSLEMQRRFGRRGKTQSFLMPVLDVESSVNSGKARAFAQAIGIREELSPTTFTVEDARILLKQIQNLYSDKVKNLGRDYREVIRPAYRNAIELLSGKQAAENDQQGLASTSLLAANKSGALRFMEAQKIFYIDRADTRERLAHSEQIWSFVVEASPAARSLLPRLFGMRILEDTLVWGPSPSETSLAPDGIERFRKGLLELVPYLLARVRAERTEENLKKQDEANLKHFISNVMPVTNLALSCKLDCQEIGVEEESQESFVNLDRSASLQSFVVWGENPWPPSPREAEALATALCDVFSPNYYESFIALLQSRTNEQKKRILRRAGAILYYDDKVNLFNETEKYDLTTDDLSERYSDADESKYALHLNGEIEEPATNPSSLENANTASDNRPSTPLYSPHQLAIEGKPIIIDGDPVRTNHNDKIDQTTGISKSGTNTGSARYGGNTDLAELDKLGMSVAISYENQRLIQDGQTTEENLRREVGEDSLVFDITKPELVKFARSKSQRFLKTMKYLEENFEISPDWPGFDILTLDLRDSNYLGRMIELKSSGVASRVQEMTWNEWKTASTGRLRENFYLYLVGNLRSDLSSAQPFIRTIRNPFGQMYVNTTTSQKTQKKIQLITSEFEEAEHLDLTIVSQEKSV